MRGVHRPQKYWGGGQQQRSDAGGSQCRRGYKGRLEAMAQTGSSSGGQTDRLRRDALGVAAITFFVVSAAAPLTPVAGGYPIAMLLGNGAGVPAAVILTTLILLIFSVGYTTMSRHIANAGS